MKKYTAAVVAIATRLGPRAASALRRAGCAGPQDIPDLPLPRQAALYRALAHREEWHARQLVMRAEARARGLEPKEERTV
jgi:hypothetical protein